MNRYILRTSLFWLLLFAVVVAVYIDRTRTVKHSEVVSQGVQPIASGPMEEMSPNAGKGSPITAGKMEAPLVPVQLTNEQMNSIGVKTGTVEYKQLNDEIRATGTVDVDERLQSSVQVRFSGYIRKVFADATYQYVRKGDPLFTIYSPDLVATQEEYLLARRNQSALSSSSVDGVATGASSLASAAEQRLRQWDIPSSEIAKLKESGKAISELSINSPASGYIMERNALPNMYVEPATKLYSLADLSRVWVNAQVFQNDVGRLKRGNSSSITVDAYPGRTFQGRVEEILPQVDMTTRTVKVRLAVSNPGVVLKPGMFVNVDLKSGLGRQLTVPASAVFQTGLRQIVFVDHGSGSIEPKDVSLGARVGDDFVVLKGLQAHQQIVTSANFLLDSESQLQAAAGSYTPPPPDAGSQPTVAIDFATDPNPAHRGPNTFRVKLSGANGQPIAGADVTVTFFMAAMPAMGMGAMNTTSQLSAKSPGVYEGTGVLESGGTWQVTVTVKQNGQTIATKQLRVNAEGGCKMLSRIIDLCARNRFLVFTGVLFLTVAGIWSLRHVPLDALPDISDVQVIVHTSWTGQPPDIIEDQVTYPIVTSLLAAPHVKAVRAQTMFGDSYVYVVFEDGTDLYWARSRVVEYLQQIGGRLPAEVHPAIGPDATGAGWVFEYAIVDKSGKHSLADLRTLQDWHLRYALETVPGVSEVASIGGYVRQYQIRLDPNKLLAYNIPLSMVIDRVKASTNEVGGRVLDLSGAQYMIRGLGYLKSLNDLESIAVGSKNGTPVLLRDLGSVAFGPDIREGVAEWNGNGETVGGIVVMRQGMNALSVIEGVKQKLRDIAPSLPAGVQIVAGYDRSGLINDSIATLQRDLLEEAIIVSLVIIVFLFHFRSALIAILALPIAVLVSFIPIYFLGVTSNIMSLGGIALAVGVLVDAAIVMVENGYRHLSERQESDATPVSEPERREILINAAKQVGPALFFSLLIIVVSFLPVFLLEAQEGRMFRPLAWTKTLAVGSSSIIAITLVPVLMVMLIRGRLKPESANPISRVTQAIYLPVLRFCLKYRKLTIALNLIFLVATLPVAFKLGSQFMPPLFEGSALYMPTSLPGIAIEQAKSLLQKQDAILRTIPEVESVFGTVGRSDSATDNAPLDMYDTTLMLKPREQWRPGMTYTKLIQEMDEKVQFPGLANTWTSPVENRLDMELTGIKTPLGLKVQGPNVDGIEQLAAKMQAVLSSMPQVRSIFAERISQGFYVNVEVNRTEAARYGLSVADVQTAVSSGIGGQNIAENIEGRERYPINVRYSQDFRDSVERMRSVLIATPSGAQIPLGQVAKVSFSHGPAMIRDEDGQLTGYVYIDLKSTNYGGFVDEATRKLQSQVSIPASYGYKWSGEYEFELRAKQRLKLILPIVFFMIFLLLYMVFHSVAEAVVLIVPTIYAMTGGLLLQWLLGYNFSVAVWVGYIALFGIAVETGVVMVVYLHEALERRLLLGEVHTNADVEAAVIEGAVKRLRPKLMTVVAVLASLAPILWESGIGSDVMKPIAAPIVGGMITSTIHVLILVPVFFVMMKERALRMGRLHPSGAVEDIQAVH